MRYTFKEYKKSELLRNHLNVGGSNPDGERIDVTSLYFERGGKPWIAVMGEYHFSRDNRENWKKELCKMKAGGITLVATYLFWIYHEEIEGEFDFNGDLDIRTFVELCKELGLDVVIRFGPWAHGECRNGGFPDWLLQKPYKLRDNNAEYLAKVKIWFDKIYEQLQGLFYKDGGNIIAVQLENELVDIAEHIAKLKEMAIDAGFVVPLYTATGWNSAAGAKLPLDEVVPVFGGYPEAPWDQHMNKQKPSSHYFFNKMRNDSAIGTDLIGHIATDGYQLPYERYPFATCELGGGIQVTHHRRPWIKPMDIYALSLVKIGSGNNLAGYYMYHGGVNKIGKLSTFNETKATGYPNDLPILSYDFQTALSEYGEAREQYGMLNTLHLFIKSFGDIIAPMEAVNASYMPKRDDYSSLRYGLRTDGNSGFVFVNHYQRLDALGDVYDVVIDTGSVVFPSIDVCGDIAFFMPYNMKLGKNMLEYATAQPLCKVDNTYFFIGINGIEAEYKFGDDIFKGSFDYNGIKIITLTWDEARYARLLLGKLYVGDKCDLYEYDGQIEVIQYGSYTYKVWNGTEFENGSVDNSINQAQVIFTDLASAPIEPSHPEELHINGERKLMWKKVEVNTDAGFIEIPFECDVAQLYADGQLVADEFYYGAKWRVPAKLLYGKEAYLVMSEMKNDFYREF